MRASLPLDRQCAFAGLPSPQREFRFHPERRWRFDWAWPDRQIAVEIEGGAFVAGRHTRGVGYVRDLEKYNAAVLMGWRLFRFTPTAVQNGEALNVLSEAMRCLMT